MSKKLVDNSGEGNCMYFAYSISLMYFLQKRNDRSIADALFNKLGLSASQKNDLHYLLNNGRNKLFTSSQIKETIEPALGPATRQFAADFTYKNFVDNPKKTGLFAATNYGMVYQFKLLLEANENDLAVLLANNKFDNKDYTEAEIFRVSGMNAMMQDFIVRHGPSIIDEFTQNWPHKAQQILLEKQGEKTLEEIENAPFYKRSLIEDIIATKTLEFFTEKDNSCLNTYCAHLNTDERWGTEETLLLMHHGLQGEKPQDGKDGYSDTEYEIEIKLHIYKNGVSTNYTNDTPDMILNSQGNVHWTSLVDLLDICGFNSALYQLEKKILDLRAYYPKASEEALNIYNQLLRIKEEFVAEDSEMTLETFANRCQQHINESSTNELWTHRGVGKLLQVFTNALIAIVSLGAFNIAYGRFLLVSPLNTNSIDIVNKLESSANSLYKNKNFQGLFNRKEAIAAEPDEDSVYYESFTSF